uniref:Uncharacterized protein n=1 Tax=Oryza meridionalis TaxID=40149 RepID=A0A0E0FAF6_9ORYZ
MFSFQQQEAGNDGLDAQAAKDNTSGNNNRDFEQYGVINTFTQLLMGPSNKHVESLHYRGGGGAYRRGR